MTVQIDLYWSFRSPYSYLAIPGAQEIEARYAAKIVFRPVLPLAVRQPEFFSEENRKRAHYIITDFPRRAEMLGIPVAFPNPDPIVQDMQTLKIASEQPYIYRLTYLGVEARRRGHGLAFAAEVSRMIWGGTPNWDKGDHLANAAQRAGLDLKSMDDAIAQPASHQAEVEQNQAALESAGHWGVPTFVYNGEPFFGQDRIDTLCWRMDRNGVERRYRVEGS